MNDKPFTLYCIPQLKDINSVNFIVDVRKISDVRTVSKGITILNLKENSNHYMIVGNNSNIISMGAVKRIETKNKNIIYVGQKIYSSSQKELYDYIKQEATKRIQNLQEEIIKLQGIKKILSNTRDNDIYNEYINTVYKRIKTIKTNSKKLITNFKKL